MHNVQSLEYQLKARACQRSPAGLIAQVPECRPNETLERPTPASRSDSDYWNELCDCPFADDPVDDGCYLEETSSFSTYDNVCVDDDEHIYHELEVGEPLHA
ncbi:unnamed protein product [Nippostrongylus brasiliensis]|uniref:Coordinator of PRMT5 and differentiation stimulator n=1 Tax=Nippostrongylus brasiliensis TaxID=27835 RepID=A0A0N4Y5T9_NIPBR|nr:unnamed protein product [Nippostrongylus brasiliensis]